MPEFLELLETFRATEASPAAIFKGDGRGVRPRFSDEARQLQEAYNKRLAEVMDIIALYHARGNHHDEYMLKETMSTSDFPLIFGDIIDRMMLGGYREAPQSYRNYCRIRQVRDFRSVNAFTMDGAEGVLDTVDQGEPYPAASLTEGRYQARVVKHGRKIPLFWEMIVNDDLGAFSDTLTRLGRAARRSEEREAATQFVDANGPHASLYTVGNKNKVNQANGASANNPPLSTSAINDALAIMALMTDADGEPIDLTSGTIHLVHGSTLKTTADQIVNTQEFRVEDPSGETRIIKGTGLGGNLRPSTNPYINQIATTNGNSSWFLFADPADSRAAIQILFLKGRAEPEIFVKAPNAQRVGGGVNPLDGDFDSDSIEYKVRHCFGSGRLDPKTTVASNGSGQA